ncbi:MAG: glycerophosphodiester phosphodiesterase [Caldilineaceae bacterium]|nr:glycerophosphodiester phosphodiesterase [Caldilineaceae bacterium]
MTAVYAHRGARRVAPENTLPAFAAALKMGVAGIELDVHLSRDGRLVVIHDETVDATTTGTGRVRDFTAAELAGLDAGSRFDPAFAGIGVPTLDDTLDLIGDRCVVNIELKTADPMGGPATEPLARLIRARGLLDQVIVSSFNFISLMRVRTLDPAIRLGLLHYAPIPDDLRPRLMNELVRPDALHPLYTLVDETYMAWARAYGCRVNVWTVNECADALHLRTLGVDVVMSDAPDEMMRCLGSAA